MHLYISNHDVYMYHTYYISMSYVKKTITIRDDEERFIEENNLKLSKIAQKAIDEIMDKGIPV